ncbi:hypothetical protein [Bartonella tribocorum]|uniref:hypothetical protein n=1 Tax=Bartonella tribocorum TaxID=85701 RepID=UPI0011776254|nr:hypothetical protein [Bartonella tribocorum]
MHEGRDSDKEYEKNEKMRNLHYLTDITLDPFERRKVELIRVRMEIVFHIDAFIILPKLDRIPVSEI